MQIDELSDEALERVLAMQRALASAASEPTLTPVFLEHFRSMTGMTGCVCVEAVDASAGTYRVRDYLRFAGPKADVDMRANARWGEPAESLAVASSPVLGRVVGGDRPMRLTGLDASSDAVLAWVEDGAFDAWALPVYLADVVTWVVLTVPPGVELGRDQLHLAVSNLNLYARSAAQLALLAEVEALHAARVREAEEIGRVQRAILPRSLPAAAGVRAAVHYAPCAEAGGDYYDFRCFDTGHLGVVVADVAGHGPASAVVMAMLRTMLTVNRWLGRRADGVVSEVNGMLFDSFGDGTFVTAVFARLEPGTGRFEYANAGHNEPRLVGADGAVSVVRGDASMPLGVVPELEPAGGEFTLRPGETLVLYTDGITEAFNAAGEQFGNDRLDATLAAAAEGGEAEPQALVDAVVEAVRVHEAGRARFDDQLVLALRYDGADA